LKNYLINEIIFEMLDLYFQQIQRGLRSWNSLPAWLQKGLSWGRQIYMLRTALKMTQTQLAGKVGTSQGSFVRIEKEEVDPRISTLNKIAEALNCQLLIRLVPKQDLKKFLYGKAKEKAERLVGMSATSAGLELQKPSEKAIRSEVRRLTEEIIDRKRSALWDD